MKHKVQKILSEIATRKLCTMDEHMAFYNDKAKEDYGLLSEIEEFIKASQEEPVSEELEEAVNAYIGYAPEIDESSSVYGKRLAFKAGAQWQKEKDAILPKVWNRKNLDDFSYQTAYDLSNDWAKETPTWDDVEKACKLGANWQKKQDQETIELAEDHAMLAGIIKGTEHTIGNVRSILNKVAYRNNGLDVNGDYCEQPYVELDNEFRKLLKEE